ncbi:MAG: hypothetical protein KDL87_12350, partial [Verrucomicrobiae bacterium]|nr:hypothetical protein [Verrucomicrobiae bacterium]
AHGDHGDHEQAKNFGRIQFHWGNCPCRIRCVPVKNPPRCGGGGMSQVNNLKQTVIRENANGFSGFLRIDSSGSISVLFSFQIGVAE